jgi:dTDP-4-amino-4,6-dideoxygalactose transaminase
MRIIPYGRQSISIQDVSEVSKSLREEKITTGNQVIKFENKINKFLRCKYSTACNSGTSAIFLSMQAIRLKKNDVVIMPAINFIAAYNVANLFGARIYLADVNKNTGQMSPQDVEDCCKKFSLKKIKAIIVMYNGGYPENAEKFIKLKKKYKSFIIEDACHALGSTYNIKKISYKVGSCKHSDISTFSLHPLKTITSGEGGIVTTNSKKLDNYIKKFRSLGIEKNPKKHWDYDVKLNGFNFRLNDFQCALGINQLKNINSFLLERKKIYNKYISELKNVTQVSTVNHIKKYQSSHHLFIMHLKKSSQVIKEKFIKFMLKNKIILQYHYIPIYKFKIFKGKYLNNQSEIYYKTAISLPIFVGLTPKEQNFIIKKINFFFNNNV